MGYVIEINKIQDIKNWFEKTVIPQNPKHITKYLIWKKFGFCPTNTTLEERRKILKGEINPYSYYKGGSAGVANRDRIIESNIQPQELLA